MQAKQRTVIRVETHSLSVIRPLQSSVNLWCERCEAIVQMFAPERAAEIINKKPRMIYRRIETGELHFMETQDGEIFVCSLSLIGDFKEVEK